MKWMTSEEGSSKYFIYTLYIDVWRSNVRSAMRAASQLPGGVPTDVDDAPAPAG